ncbi:DUF2971 domain-containing protein [Herbaspirillum sp. RTI4]|uniref:DUF2971 domain-containing protein n=1 Tax=Herbaspirillum sp. RTI4 TaxID=3048640 RepID=UPI002AB56C27|nr:DUF2971 domain-containing protein [Herbaspirillum sp. RTI4]MDY7579269.1 DUF2971 domain-containing protein [Herbaspirillum sp. RTI4]MEA9982768.1 DUF2971 domain-containing protein [Herbaspirillum sp. RTI4]
MSDLYSLYKFYRITPHFLKSLVNNTLWCAATETLNDPFDCQIHLLKLLTDAQALAVSPIKEKLSHALGKDKKPIIEKITQKLKSVGVCAFSIQGDHPLMWSHYADGHKGVCLRYEFPSFFFEMKKNILLGCDNVTYSKNRLTEQFEKGFIFNDLSKFTTVYLTSKDKPWEYENEFRILSHSPGPLKLPMGYLTQVCFGLRTPEEDIELVKKLATQFAGIHKFHQMKHGPDDFGLQIRQI